MENDMAQLNIDLSNINTKTLADAEATILSVAMEQNRYNQSKTATQVGLSRGALRYKLREYFGNKYVGSKGV
jgi:Fis family transcriptional regulator